MSQLKFAEHAAVQNPKYLVIFLHGYGSNGEDLLSLCNEFSNILPEAHFISPNAVQPWEGGFPGCYQWFSLNSGFDSKGIEEMAPDIKKSSNILSDFIDEQLVRFSLTRENLFLIGFSQGAMMSMHQGLTSKEKLAGIVAFSGKLASPDLLGEELSSKPEICLIHGESDPVVPFDYFLKAKDILEEHNFSFEAHSIPNLEHSIDLQGIEYAQNFIKKIITK